MYTISYIIYIYIYIYIKGSDCSRGWSEGSLLISNYNYIYIYIFHHTTCGSTCDTLASSADEARVSHVLPDVVWWKKESIYIYILKVVIVVEGGPKAPFWLATTTGFRGWNYSFLWIVPLYPWFIPYNAEC